MVSEILIKIFAVVLLIAVAVVLILGIGTLFKGGETSKKYSNKLMQLRVLLQFIAIIILVSLAYFFKD
tara:strand:+ start:1185 stop:1388 length:204 start_codon:yes stop_codon:yes gene_type:complete